MGKYSNFGLWTKENVEFLKKAGLVNRDRIVAAVILSRGDKAFLKKETIAKIIFALGESSSLWSISTITRSIRNLERRGILRSRANFGRRSDKLQGANDYYIVRNPEDWAVVAEQNLIKMVGGKEGTKQFLATLGFVPGVPVTIITQISGNVIVNIKESRVAISCEIAQKIMV
jgi:ferrous iron transport protein A